MQVFWSREAEHKLTKMWMSADDQKEVTVAANQIDQRLRREPSNTGIGLANYTGEIPVGIGRLSVDFEQIYIYVEPPLTVAFTVSKPDMRVDVIQVWRSRSRRTDDDSEL